MDNDNMTGTPSLEAIDFAKRMIALKWTKETNVNIVAGNWQAGYVYGKIDSSKEQEGLISMYDRGMSEYYMQHNYREMYALWQKFKDELKNKNL